MDIKYFQQYNKKNSNKEWCKTSDKNSPTQKLFPLPGCNPHELSRNNTTAKKCH